MTVDTSTGWKNVVIIGASFAGHTLANILAKKLPSDYRVILIERTPFAIHLPALVRGVTVPGSHKAKLTAPLAQDTVFKDGERHVLLTPVSAVELRENSVVLDTEFEGSNKVPFVRCIYAVGSQQPPPMRPAPGTTLSEYHALLTRLQDDIETATSVLVIGGGAAGVEIAGEITSHYPDKKVTLVHSRDRLLVTADSLRPPDTTDEKAYGYKPVAERLSETLQSQLRARGTNIILSDRVVFPDDNAAAPSTQTEPGEIPWSGKYGGLGRLETITLKSGKKVQADNVVLSVGNKPNSGLMAKFAPDAVTPTGHVAVDRELRVVSAPGSEASTRLYYALGDVTSTPGRKTAGQANAEAHQLASILLSHIKDYEQGREETKRPRRLAPISGIVVPLGDGTFRTPDGKPKPGDGIGAGSYDLGWFGVWRAPLFLIRWFAKTYFADQHFLSRFVGSRKVTGEETGEDEPLPNKGNEDEELRN